MTAARHLTDSEPPRRAQIGELPYQGDRDPCALPGLRP